MGEGDVVLRRGWRSARLTAGALAFALVAAGCAGADGVDDGAGEDRELTVLMVDNPQMQDIQKLTAANFTARTGIEVNFTILPENELRSKVTQDIATGTGQYDVATIGAYEVPIWASNGWLHEVSSYAEADEGFDSADLLPSMTELLSSDDGLMYGMPFYGESSMLMYRKDVFEQRGLTMPERPTWDQVAQLATQVDGAQPGMRGICLRGLPGWGEMFAPLTTVINTYGGTWYTEDWRAQVNSPEFAQATQFYVDLVRAHGEPDAATSGFTECLDAMSTGKVAMWYDATSGAGTLEDPAASQVAGRIGYAYAPVSRTESAGWLWAWSWGMPADSKNADNAAKFILWASSKEYENLVGEQLGWSRVPAGKRASTYENPDYQAAASAFADITLESIQRADPVSPGLQPRPTVGIQYVAVPEFADLATTISQDISAAIAGDGNIGPALENGQKLAQQTGDKYQGF
ncbi:ABC transporter substrate-binding protein [Pseudonocardia lacus]|uniref:ABC transporter substrate-binding protein n=1 Tax=Pseudonocardia lacus TaxID=2835865 RepID=UPI001BDD78F6|nr:sugar ABC transporter substrate-binding protein [Pseudonocardia lacus]